MGRYATRKWNPTWRLWYWYVICNCLLSLLQLTNNYYYYLTKIENQRFILCWDWEGEEARPLLLIWNKSNFPPFLFSLCNQWSLGKRCMHVNGVRMHRHGEPPITDYVWKANATTLGVRPLVTMSSWILNSVSSIWWLIRPSMKADSFFNAWILFNFLSPDASAQPVVAQCNQQHVHWIIVGGNGRVWKR